MTSQLAHTHSPNSLAARGWAQWPWWQQVLLGIPVGIAVGLFAAIRWPLDLIVVGLLPLYAVAMALAWRMNVATLRQFAVVTAFLAVGLFSLLVGIVTIMLPANPWLPAWALSIAIALALGLAGLAALTGARR